MKDTHIIEVIDNAALASLSKVELDEVKAHARECVTCGTAFEAAQVSALMIKERAQVKFGPSPFFQTRVLAAVREQQSVDNVPAFVRLWKSASALVSAMAVATMLLGAMTFVYPDTTTALVEQTVSADAAEAMLFDQDEQATYEQVLSTIYYEEDEAR